MKTLTLTFAGHYSTATRYTSVAVSAAYLSSEMELNVLSSAVVRAKKLIKEKVRDQLLFESWEDDYEPFSYYSKGATLDESERRLRVRRKVADLFAFRYLLRFMERSYSKFHTDDLVLRLVPQDKEMALVMANFCGTTAAFLAAPGENPPPTPKPPLSAAFGQHKREPEPSFLHTSVWKDELAEMSKFPLPDIYFGEAIVDPVRTAAVLAGDRGEVYPMPTESALLKKIDHARKSRHQRFLDEVGHRHRQRIVRPKRRRKKDESDD